VGVCGGFFFFFCAVKNIRFFLLFWPLALVGWDVLLFSFGMCKVFYRAVFFFFFPPRGVIATPNIVPSFFLSFIPDFSDTGLRPPPNVELFHAYSLSFPLATCLRRINCLPFSSSRGVRIDSDALSSFFFPRIRNPSMSDFFFFSFGLTHQHMLVLCLFFAFNVARHFLLCGAIFTSFPRSC